ncbi:MAG: hypothetical protein IPG59_11345 [Candidatus Melainabacteria bacterium]|nr:MAG: hypothetical protein IPG59_11345 [Candidatus Melainabacteria bacterium]
MTTTMIVTLLLLIFLVPGMSLGMALIGLFRSKLWTMIAATALAACALAYMPGYIVAIPVGYMFLGIWYARNDPDLLYQIFTW